MDNKTKFTYSQVKYMINLYRISRLEQGVKNTELAAALGFTKPSVHNMLKSLIELGVVMQESFGLAHLTDLGRSLAVKYECCYRYIHGKLSDICGEGAVSENAICGLLADMPGERVVELYCKIKVRGL